VKLHFDRSGMRNLERRKEILPFLEAALKAIAPD
jgi:hypothetical protein